MCNISGKWSIQNFDASKSLTSELPAIRLRGWQAYRCILLLHVIFYAPLGDRIADSTAQKIQRPRGNGDKWQESNLRHKDGGSTDVSQKENNLKDQKKQTKRLITLKRLVDFWSTPSGTSNMISLSCMHASSLSSWGMFVFNKIPSLHLLNTAAATRLNKSKKETRDTISHTTLVTALWNLVEKSLFVVTVHYM